MSQIDTGTEHLLAHREGGVLVLTMNRPERRNALSAEMLRAMLRMTCCGFSLRQLGTAARSCSPNERRGLSPAWPARQGPARSFESSLS